MNVMNVSSTHQAPVLDLLSAVQIIKSLKKFMCNMRNSSTEYDQIFKTTIDICKKNNTVPEVVKKKFQRK